MTWRKREIMDMAREAGIRDCACSGEFGCLEAFAKLVREDALAQPEQEGTSMTDKEAMKLALEALTNAYWPTDSDLLPTHNIKECAEAITAIKEALAQPEQEPVAWKWRVKNFCDWPNWSVSLKRPADSGHAQYPRTEGYEDIPLYATPPQRTWVGLNWDDLPEIYVGDTAFLHGAKWAEAKLKEKTHD